MNPTDLRDMSAQQVIDALGMDYLEGEGCWVSLIWRTEHANAIYALLTPEDFSAMHRLNEDEAWTHIAGAPAQMLILDPAGSHELITLGTEMKARQSPQTPHYRIPGGSWQGTLTTGEWTLVSCVLVPPFTEFELATEETDLTTWAAVHQDIADRMRESP
ncbi:MAG TPA: cupin domain-containing protein [Candidatus Nanopelagicales bacterium]|nr:cupin domain-containing protein [Candidatus Nanopelagicales bacterium]